MNDADNKKDGLAISETSIKKNRSSNLVRRGLDSLAVKEEVISSIKVLEPLSPEIKKKLMLQALVQTLMERPGIENSKEQRAINRERKARYAANAKLENNDIPE